MFTELFDRTNIWLIIQQMNSLHLLQSTNKFIFPYLNKDLIGSIMFFFERTFLKNDRNKKETYKIHLCQK